MRVFFRCVAEAVVENGLKGLAAMVPGGPYAYAVAESAWKKYRERCTADQQLKELRVIAEAKLEDARAEMVGIAREVFAAVPAGPAPMPDEVIDLELYVSGIPDAVRQSLKRPDDPTGRSVPNGFALRSADDVLKLLPTRPPRFRPGDALPGKSGWVLEQLLGMGGFGEVWFTRHVAMDSLSGAVKFCFGQSGRDLIHEAGLINRVMKAGSHPYIVPLRDVHLEGDRPWLLFEYIAGGNLTDWIHLLSRHPPAARQQHVLAALRQLCDAVAYFHRLPIPVVHRDLKPSNILYDSAAKRLRVTDFGIGSITATETNRLESRGQGTRGGRLLSYLRGSCTPLYSSPQQRMGADPDPRDDVHALGVIAFQLLTGRLDAAPAVDAAEDMREAGVGDDLIAIVSRCVAHKPERRPKDAGELLAALAGHDKEQTRRKNEEERVRQEGERKRKDDEEARRLAEMKRLQQEAENKLRAEEAAAAERQRQAAARPTVPSQPPRPFLPPSDPPPRTTATSAARPAARPTGPALTYWCPGCRDTVTAPIDTSGINPRCTRCGHFIEMPKNRRR